jgi:hypothetical protein
MNYNIQYHVSNPSVPSPTTGSVPASVQAPTPASVPDILKSYYMPPSMASNNHTDSSTPYVNLSKSTHPGSSQSQQRPPLMPIQTAPHIVGGIAMPQPPSSPVPSPFVPSPVQFVPKQVPSSVPSPSQNRIQTNPATGGVTSNSEVFITEVDEFTKSVQAYVKKHNTKVYILTPCYNGTVYVTYMQCLINTLKTFLDIGIPLSVEFCKCDSLVPRARNNLIAKAMADPTMTHAMFIDADISWEPLDIIKLIISDKALIGGIYPLKQYQWSKLLKDPQNPYNTNVVQTMLMKKNGSQLASIISDETTVQCNMVKYNVNYIDSMLKIEYNMAKVKHIATGFMMIQRTALERLMVAHPKTKYVDDVGFLKPHEQPYAYALFDCEVVDGHYYSEDWLFCHRWTQLGGETWMDVSINLTHTGVEDYKGCYITSIM